MRTVACSRVDPVLLLCLFISSLAGSNGLATGAPAPAGFDKQVKISFQTSFLEADLADFPVLVTFTPESLDYDELTSRNALCFYDPGTATELPWECEQYEPGGESHYWVKVPAIKAGSPETAIWVYYGGNTSRERQAEVWNSGYRGVWHFGAQAVDDRSLILDSTAYGNHGRAKGTEPAEGRIGPGRRFSSDQHIEAPDDASLNIEGELTLEAWVRLDKTPATCMGILEKKDDYQLAAAYTEQTGPEFRFRVFEPDRAYPRGDHYVRHTGDPRPRGGRWFYVVGTKDRHGVLRTYVNGRIVGVRDVGAFPTSMKSHPLYIGFLKRWDCHFEGELDEVRVSDRAYSADWARAQYLAGRGQFARVGSEGSGGPVEGGNPRIGVPVQTAAGEFKLESCPRVERFFGLGFYGICPPRWTAASAQVVIQRNLELQARNWANMFYPVGSRFRDRVWRHRYDVEEEPEDFDRAQCWIDILRDDWIPLLRKYGMRYMANAEGFAGSRNPPYSELDVPERIEQIEKAVSAFKDDDSLMGWYIEDEPGDGLLPNYLAVKKMFETRDRNKLALCLFYRKKAVMTFAPYQQVMLTDCYKVDKRYYDPWGVLRHMKTVGSITDAPHWLTLFAAWDATHPAARITPSELGLTSWLAIAGGAKSIQYYIYHRGPYFRWGAQEGVLVDAYGNTTPHMEACRRFAEKVVPAGELLTRAKPNEHTGIAADTPQIQIHYTLKWNDYREWVPAVYVGVLRHEDGDGYLLVPVNQDLEQSRPVRIQVPATLREGKRLYDLVALSEVPYGDGVYDCGGLAPGEGHLYMLASEGQFSEARSVVLKARARQGLRVAGLDMEKAARWGVEQGEWGVLVRQAEDDIEARLYTSAIDTARKVSSQVERELAEAPLYAESTEAVESLRKLFGDIQKRLDYLRALDRLDQRQVDRAIDLSDRFSRLSEDLFLGRSDTLVEEAQELSEEVEEFASGIPEVEIPQPPESVEERVQYRIEWTREQG